MNIPMQPNAFQTLQEQLAEFLRAEIQRGKFAPGDRLYSEAELKKKTGLSFVTIKRALATLAEEGLVVRRQGKGTFVKDREIVIRQSVDQLHTFVRDYGAMGYQVSIELLSFEISRKNEPDVLEELGLDQDEAYYRFVRVLSLDGQPIIYQYNYLPERLFPGITAEDLRERVPYDILSADYATDIKRARGAIIPVNLSQTQAEHLQSSRGKAALLYSRTSYDQRDRPVSYSKTITRDDRYQFTYEVRQD